MTKSPRERSPGTLPGSPDDERLCVAVASDQSLIAEAVRAALASRGHEVVALRWPDEADVPRQRRRGEPPRFDVGLLISELDRWARVQAAMRVLARVDVPWAVLTTAPRGPVWGATLAAGAQVVLPGRLGLEDIGPVLVGLVHGVGGIDPEERAELESSWLLLRDQHDLVSERLSRLTPRETEVLRLLYVGQSVVTIAGMLEVTPATVRSQVKSVLRKLDVNSQLAAVAALRDALDPVTPPIAG